MFALEAKFKAVVIYLRLWGEGQPLEDDEVLYEEGDEGMDVNGKTRPTEDNVLTDGDIHTLNLATSRTMLTRDGNNHMRAITDI